MKISKKNGGKRFYRFRITFFRHCPSSADNDSYRGRQMKSYSDQKTYLAKVDLGAHITIEK